MHPLVVFMLLACVLSAAYVMRPDEEGTGNTYQAFSLLRRPDSLQEQRQQPLPRDTVRCKLLHSRDAQHGSSLDATICAEQSSDGSQQQVTIWSVHSISNPSQDSLQESGSDSSSSRSSYAYAHAAEGAEYGHHRRRAVHRKTLMYLAQRR